MALKQGTLSTGDLSEHDRYQEGVFPLPHSRQGVLTPSLGYQTSSMREDQEQPLAELTYYFSLHAQVSTSFRKEGKMS